MSGGRLIDRWEAVRVLFVELGERSDRLECDGKRRRRG